MNKSLPENVILSTNLPLPSIEKGFKKTQYFPGYFSGVGGHPGPVYAHPPPSVWWCPRPIVSGFHSDLTGPPPGA